MTQAQTREFYHALRQIHNFYRLPHVQHKDIATLGHGTGLNDQLRRLGYGHEKARHFRVRQGNGAAFLNLLAKLGYDRAGRTQHITKAYHAKAGT